MRDKKFCDECKRLNMPPHNLSVRAIAEKLGVKQTRVYNAIAYGPTKGPKIGVRVKR